MKKLKEKIANNEKIIFIKNLWSNKKTRSLIWLGGYFIFFLLLSIFMRMSPASPSSTPISSTEENKCNPSVVMDNLNNLSKSSYSYDIMVNNELVSVKIDYGFNTFTYGTDEYVFMYNKLYKNSSDGLEVVDNLLNSNIPIEKLVLSNIVTYLNNINYNNNSIIDINYELDYEVPIDRIFTDELGYFNIKLIGNNNVTDKIVVDYKDEEYILKFY